MFYLDDGTLLGGRRALNDVAYDLKAVELAAGLGPTTESLQVRDHLQGPQHKDSNAPSVPRPLPS